MVIVLIVHHTQEPKTTVNIVEQIHVISLKSLNLMEDVKLAARILYQII